jgi:hypothetical protein
LVAAHDINNSGQILATIQRVTGGEGEFARVMVLEPITPSGSDTTPPSLTLTSPTTNTYATDLVAMQATASDNVGVVGVQFYADGQPIGPEDTTAPYAADWDLAAYGPTTGDVAIPFWAVARDAAGNRTVTNIKSLVYRNRCSTVTPELLTANGWLGNQTGTFTVRWTGEAHLPGGTTPIEAGFALALGRQGFFSGTSAAVLFAPDGEIKVRNGASYPPSGLRYADGATYHFRIVVDVPNNRYSVFYKLANEPERQLAASYQFRKPATTLDYWMVHMDELSPQHGSLDACNIRVTAGP